MCIIWIRNLLLRRKRKVQPNGTHLISPGRHSIATAIHHSTTSWPPITSSPAWVWASWQWRPQLTLWACHTSSWTTWYWCTRPHILLHSKNIKITISFQRFLLTVKHRQAETCQLDLPLPDMVDYVALLIIHYPR